jgi:hypothetical protein
VLAQLPRSEHGPLVLGAGESLVPATSCTDPEWLHEQVRLRGRRWRTSDPRVLTTLWWYSASVWLPCPSLASLVLTGAALSPHLEDVDLHWLPDSRLTGTTSSRVLPGTDPVLALGVALRAVYEQVIPVLAAVGEMKQRPLWAIATDSLAGRLLWAAPDPAVAASASAALASAIGSALPRPRFVELHGRPLVRRCSC